MKILQCHNFYQSPGGEDKVFADERALLESRGHQVIRYERHNDDINPMGKFEVFGKTLWNRDTTDDLSRLIQAGRPDVMHCHNIFPLISPSAYHVAKKLKVAVVQTLHNYRLICPNAQLLRNGSICEKCVGKKLAWPAVLHGCYHDSRLASSAVVAMLSQHWQRGTWTRFVDRYIALSHFSKQKFIEGGFPAGKIEVKPNFVGAEPDPGAGSGDYAIFVGRLSPEKGVQTLLNAWKLLKDDLQLKIVGDGPLAETVAAAAAGDSRISWLGAQPAAAVQPLIGEAKFLVMPSIWFEPFGLATIEAFAMGAPVIASRTGAMSEIVEEGKTGLLFESGNANALANTIAHALENPALLAKMRTGARLKYERQYTAKGNYTKLMGIYRNAIEAANPSEH